MLLNEVNLEPQIMSLSLCTLSLVMEDFAEINGNFLLLYV